MRVPTLGAARERLADEPVDCVLLDLSLPDAQGLEALAGVRAAAPDAPVVVLTGMPQDALALQALDAGAQDYLIKGETPGPVLVRSIRYAIDRRHEERKLALLAMSDGLGRAPGPAPAPARPAAGAAVRTAAELDDALERGELVVHYQPQVALARGRALAGVEAVVRRHRPDRGLAGTDELLAPDADAGAVRRLCAWVLEEVCAAARGLAGARPGRRRVLHGRSTCPRASSPTTASCRSSRRRCARYGLPAGALCLEVPESALLAGDDVPARLRALRGLGVRIAVDGFGLGWGAPAGLAPLPRASRSSPLSLAADAVKLDRRLVADMAAGPQAAHVVGAVVGLARTLGLQPIAEGVDTLELSRALAALGVELAQGNAFSRACSPAAVEALLAADVRRDAAAEGPVRVFLCDDAPGLRALLRACLELDGDLVVVGEAGDGAGLADAVRAVAADVVLLDLSMPNVDGLEALADVRAGDADLAVIVLSGFDARRMEAQALALGADRYVEKATPMQEIAGIVRAVVTARRGPRPLLEAVA